MDKCTPMSPWEGRLRSHHTTPQSLPKRRLPSQTKDLEEKEELQKLKKQAAPKKKTARGRHAGAAAQQPRASLSQSSQLAGGDPEHPIVIDDDVNGEHETRADRSAITSLRRSPRFHPEVKSLGKSLLPPNRQETSANRKTKTAHRKDKNQASLKKNKGNAGFPPRKHISVVSNKNSDKEESKPNHCKVQTGKKKRGTERLSSKKQSCQDPKPLPAYCQEIAPRNEPRKSTHKRIGKDPSIEVKLKVGDQRLASIDENINPSEIGREEMGNFCCSDDWTKEQDMALRKAYFSARPSPHFWKRVSKMVPGKSAAECFDRIFADLSTPTPIGPRTRTSKTTYSPIGNFTLSDPELPKILEPTVVGRRNTIAAQKTVRHLLQKHRCIDQAQEADHFSVFEGSPSALQLNISLEDSPGTPDSYMDSDSLGKRSGSSLAQKKPFSRLRTKPSEPSPAVLKPIKNVILHERYIDRLARRERVGTKRPRRRAPAGSKAADSGTFLSDQQAGSVKAAKNALISEATDFIGRFKALQANSLAQVVENSEDEIDSDASDCSDG